MNAQVQEDNLPTIVRPGARSAMVEVAQSRAVAQEQAAMLLARKFPRNELEARDKIVNAFTSPKLAEDSKYAYARGGSDIEGPTIRSLEAIARLWGNIRCGVEELTRAQGQSECRAYAMDMETGFQDEKTFVVRHIRDTKKGSYPVTDERDLYELIANMGARRKRACLEAVIPGDVVEEAMAQADVTLKTNFEITPEYTASLLTAFEKFGVTKAMVEVRIQRHIDALTPAQAVTLKKIHTSLREGMSKPADWFDMEAPAAGEQPKPAAGVEGVKDRVRKARAQAPAAAEPAPGDVVAPMKATGGPEPITDEAVALLAMEKAKEGGEGEIVLAQCKGQPFYGRLVDAFNQRFAESL